MGLSSVSSLASDERLSCESAELHALADAITVHGDHRSSGISEPTPAATSWHPRTDSSSTKVIRHIVDVHHGFLHKQLDNIGVLLEEIEPQSGDENSGHARLSRMFRELKCDLEKCMGHEERTIFPQIERWAAKGDEAVLASPPRELIRAAKELERLHAALLQRLWRIWRRARDTSRFYGDDHRWANLVRELSALCDDHDQHLFEEDCLLLPRIAAWDRTHTPKETR